MAGNYTHRNLILWQRAQELGYQVSKLTHRLPQSWANAVLARQIVSAATSVGANIAEGHGRYTLAAHRNHLLIREVRLLRPTVGSISYAVQVISRTPKRVHCFKSVLRSQL